MKIAIIGASGFVGTALVKKLKSHPYEPVLLPLSRKDFDLANPDSWKQTLEGVDCVVNCAVCIDGEMYETYQVNTIFAYELALHLNALKIQKFLNISTGAVYGLTDIPTHPKMACEPVGCYPISKYLGERIFEDHYKGHLNNIRLYYPYGHGQKEPRLLPRLARLINEGKNVRCGKNGGPYLSFTKVGDIAEILIGDFILADSNKVICNIAPKEKVPILSAIKQISEILEKEPQIEYLESTTDVISEPYENYAWKPFTLTKEMISSFLEK